MKRLIFTVLAGLFLISGCQQGPTEPTDGTATPTENTPTITETHTISPTFTTSPTNIATPTPDSYEDDDVYSAAYSITPDGTPLQHNSHDTCDDDWVTFDAVAGSQYLIETSGLEPLADTVLYFYSDPVSAPDITNDDYIGPQSRIVWVCSSSGTYYVRQQQYNCGARWGHSTGYLLSVIESAPFTPTATVTATPTITLTNTPQDTPTITPSATETGTPTLTETVTGTPPTQTYTMTATLRKTNTPDYTATVTFTITQTLSSTATFTQTPTITATGLPSAANLWHAVDETATVVPSVTPGTTPQIYWYGQDATGDYDTGEENRGALIIGPLSVAAGEDLKFLSYEHTENTAGYDRRLVFISSTGSGPWTLLAELSGPEEQWREVTADLASYEGGDVYIMFVFDTVDDFQNNYPGWFIDEIRVEP